MSSFLLYVVGVGLVAELRGFRHSPLCGNGDLDLDTSLDVDDDLLDNVCWGLQAI